MYAYYCCYLFFLLEQRENTADAGNDHDRRGIDYFFLSVRMRFRQLFLYTERENCNISLAIIVMFSDSRIFRYFNEKITRK